MNAPAPSSRRPILLFGLAAAILFLVLVARFWHPVFGFTRFLQLDASNDEVKIAAFKSQPVYVYRNTGGYDGLYYAQIAYHPALTAAELAPAMDTFAYRARRILAPALAWLLAAGQPAWIAQVYSVLNVAAWLVLAALLWRLLPVADLRGFMAWAGVLFSAGALGSVRFALTDLVALAILAGALLAAERQRGGTATGLLAAAGLARETSLLALAGLVRTPWLSRANLARALLAALPLGAWLAYVAWRVGPADPGWGNFTPPFAGIAAKWRADLTASLHPDSDHRLLTWTTLLATLGLTAQAVFILTRRRRDNPWWRTGAAYSVLLLLLGTAVWHGFPGAATRVLLPLTLTFNVLAVRLRSGLGWLVAGNLGVLSGLWLMTGVHQDPRELAAARVGGVAVVARAQDGWFDREHTARHAWAWSHGRGMIEIEAWPRASQALQFACTLRSLASRTVTVTQDGVPLWRGEVGAGRLPVSLRFNLRDGRARLEFSSDAAAVPENPDGTGRHLAFAVYDPRLAMPERTP